MSKLLISILPLLLLTVSIKKCDHPKPRKPISCEKKLIPDYKDSNNIPHNLNEAFAQLDTILCDSFKYEFKYGRATDLHWGLGMWIRNNWGLWANSNLSKYFLEKGLWHPDDISSVILISFYRKLNDEPIKLEEQIAYYKEYWEKVKLAHEGKSPEALATKELLKKLNVEINTLPKVKHKITYNFKGEPCFKEKLGDTIIYWASGMEGPMEQDGIKNLVKQEEFGKSIYITYIEGDGSISVANIGNRKFLIRNDSLFYLDDNEKPRLYFTCSLFNKNQYKHFQYYDDISCGDSIILHNYWRVKNKNIYQVELTNSCGEYGIRYDYIFDENFNIWNYDSTILSKKDAFTESTDISKFSCK